jgi:hypothetical protein
MSNADQPLEAVPLTPVQPANTPPHPTGSPPRPTLDDAFRTASQLDPDDRLRLVARLWKSLPADHRAALVTLQLEEVHGDREHSPIHTVPSPVESIWPKIYERLFDPRHTSDLYSAPRRFDLATIFVVTAAFSLLLGGLSALDAPPIVMVVIASLLAIVAATQALFREVANPRGVSIVTGAVAYTLMSWIIWLTIRRVFPNSFFFVTVVNGILGGALFGYLAGTLVGGVFLVADILRGKFEGRGNTDATEASHTPTSPLDEPDHEPTPTE